MRDAAWHARRRQGIGGSDVAAILGLSPWRSALDVWAEKVGESEPDDASSLAMWLGLRLEPVIFELYEARTGRKVRRLPPRQHPKYPWMLATLDAKVAGESVAVEAKTSSTAEGWGEDGSDVIPLHYYPQAQHYLAVTGYARTDVAVLIGNRRFHVHPIERNDDYILDLVEVEREFWERHVVAKVPPPPDGSESAGRFLRRRFRDHGELLRVATPEERLLAVRLAEARRRAKEVERAAEEVAQLVQQAIGNDAGLQGPGFTITWKRSKDAAVTNWEAVANAYRQLAEPHVSVETLDTLREVHTDVREGTRRFLARFEEE